MTLDLAWAYGFNVVINSLLAFVTVAFLVKFLLWVLRIQQPRIQAVCLSLPLFKVGLDLFYYDFSRWALAHQVNPLLCEPGTRAFTLRVSSPLNTGIHFSLADGKTFTVADIITLSIDPLAVKLIVLLVLTISVGLCAVRFVRGLKARQRVKTLQQIHYARTVSVPLQAALNRNHVQIFHSSDVDVPCAVGKSIIFPEKLLDQLSQAEFEAIVVHELDHLRWRDSALRTAQQILCTFFWWIPTKRWQSRLEQAQELACDAKMGKYHLAPVELASAIAKAARAAKTSGPCLPVMYFVEKGRLLSRMKALIKPSLKRSLGIRITQGLLIFCLMSLIFFGQFWIF